MLQRWFLEPMAKHCHILLGIFVLSVIHCPSLFYRPWLIDLVWVRHIYVLWPGQGNTKWLLLPLLQISKVITILFCQLVHIWTSVISRWVRPLVSRLLKPRWLVDLRTTRQFWTGRSLFMAFVVRIETFSLQQVTSMTGQFAPHQQFGTGRSRHLSKFHWL